MTSRDTQLRHGALVYQSQEEYLARAVPFLREGLEAGEGLIVAHTKPGMATMREALNTAQRALPPLDRAELRLRRQ